jgi:hypothetical protein
MIAGDRDVRSLPAEVRSYDETLLKIECCPECAVAARQRRRIQLVHPVTDPGTVKLGQIARISPSVTCEWHRENVAGSRSRSSMPSSHGRDESLMPSLDMMATVLGRSGVLGRI